MTTNTLNEKRRALHEQIEALANKPSAPSGRFVFALILAGVVLFGGLAATFYASAAQREEAASSSNSGFPVSGYMKPNSGFTAHRIVPVLMSLLRE